MARAEWLARVPTRLWTAAVLVGCGIRLLLTWGRPLWHDEIYTLTLARRGALAILSALVADTGPPLHYLAARVLLLPVPAPGGADVLVRLFSVAASLLHVPLLLRIARRLGEPAIGWRAAGLLALCPLAASYGAEGRAYALASLLALAGLERSLVLRERASLATGLAVALACAGAVLSHYLAAFTLAGSLAVLAGAAPRARWRLAGAWALGALLALPWVPVALQQPAAGLAWMQAVPVGERLVRLASGLALGVDASMVALAVAGGVLLAAAAVRAARLSAAGRTLGGVLGCALAALAVAGALRPDVLIPPRAIVCLLPLAALVVAAAGDGPALVLAAAFTAGLAVEVPAALVPTPGEQLVAFLEPEVRAGATVCVAGIGALETDYRLQRAGLPGRVRYFPSDLAGHPGWHDDRSPATPLLRREVAALRAEPDPPELFVLPHGARASLALREWLDREGVVRVGRSPWVDVLRRPRRP